MIVLDPGPCAWTYYVRGNGNISHYFGKCFLQWWMGIYRNGPHWRVCCLKVYSQPWQNFRFTSRQCSAKCFKAAHLSRASDSEEDPNGDAKGFRITCGVCGASVSSKKTLTKRWCPNKVVISSKPASLHFFAACGWLQAFFWAPWPLLDQVGIEMEMFCLDRKIHVFWCGF